MAVADTDVNIFDDTENSGNGGGGGGMTDIDVISSRNTIEVSRSGNTFDVNVANEDSRNFFVKNFHEFMDAVQTIANLYIGGDKVGNVIQLTGNIDMTDPSAEDEANYVLSNGDYLIDLPNKTYNLRQYLHYTKIVSYGAKRSLQLLHPNAARTSYDTFQLNVIRLTAENIGIGGDIAAWIDEFNHGYVSRSLPCEFQRYLFSSPGNVYYDLRSCNITCAGASQNTPNAFNPLMKMDGTLNSGIWISAMYFTDCRFIAGRSLLTPDSDLNAPIVINSNWFEGRRKILQFKQMSKEVNDTVLETGAPNIQIRTDNVAQAQTTWRSHQWEVSTDGTALVSCSAGEDCLAFAPKLALNDLYLQGTPLTPPGNPPTENFVSLVSLLQNMGEGVVITSDNNQINDGDGILGQRQNELGNSQVKRFGMWNVANFIRQNIGLIDFYIYDPNNNDSRLLLVSEVKSTDNSSKQLSGLLYYNVSMTDVVDGCVQKIYVSWNHGAYSVRTDLLQQNGEIVPIKPCIVQYQSKYYIALQQFGKYSRIYFIGHQSLELSAHETPTTLYYDSNAGKWYSNRERTSEVAVTFYVEPSRFPANNLDFGGTSSQVVAGDGTFLNWGDKLGYWEGQTADLPPIGSREANKLYITTDY